MLRNFAIPVVLVAMAAGCCRENHTGEASPDRAFSVFRERLLADDHDAAYELFSENTQKRYSGYEFWGLLTKTRAGKLISYQLATWNVAGIELSADGKSAWLTLRHPTRAEFKNRYELVAVPGKEGEPPLWKIRFYLADVLGSPREEEEYLFGKDSKSNP